jgi:hypothetical protein
MKSPWVSDWEIWVAMECSCHDLAIFPGMFGLGTMSYPCDNGEGPILLPGVASRMSLIFRNNCLCPTWDSKI